MRISVRSVFPALTTRQANVLVLLLQGHSNKAVAREFNISERTVEDHRSDIYKKTETRSLPELCTKVIKHAGLEIRS